MPILFTPFCKIETATKVFNAIKKSKPKKLYVFSDGWRATVASEKENVEYLRKWIVENVDWDCEVFTNFQEKNLGTRFGIEAAIDWFFENEEMGIILEDDALPAPELFRFCSEMLMKYKDDERVYLINGANIDAKKTSANSYFFKDDMGGSDIWGWATWRRVWKKHDKTMSQYEKYKNQCEANENNPDYSEYLKNERMKFLLHQIGFILSGKMETWNFQLYFSIAANNGLYLIPECNLVTNIGCGTQGFTHTGSEYYLEGIIPTGEFLFPIEHPMQVSARRLTGEEYINTVKSMRDFQDFEKTSLLNFLSMSNFLKRFNFISESQLSEICQSAEADNLVKIILNAISFKKHYKAQKYFYLALSKGLLKGDKNPCSNCNNRKCLSVCPSKSISSHQEENGEIAVKIDRKTCQYCWNCMKSCPFVASRRQDNIFNTKELKL